MVNTRKFLAEENVIRTPVSSATPKATLNISLYF
jgi:hypothetical protein